MPNASAGVANLIRENLTHLTSANGRRRKMKITKNYLATRLCRRVVDPTNVVDRHIWFL